MNNRIGNLVLRALILQSIRDYFTGQGFLEVETPYLIPANAPEEYIDPVQAGDSFLQTSPEICMKRLLCRGYKRIFQISRCWRSAERGNRHLTEFSMLEWYRADSDYYQLMEDCEKLLQQVTRSCLQSDSFIYKGSSVFLAEGFHRLCVKERFEACSPVSMESAIRAGSFDEMLVTYIEPALPRDRPVILMDYPEQMAALARLKESDTSVAERFELYVAGLELANGFSELNDTKTQRLRFMAANRVRTENGHPALPLPLPFLNELSCMPISSGIALGIDRLVMLLANEEKIDNVVAFTPEEL